MDKIEGGLMTDATRLAALEARIAELEVRLASSEGARGPEAATRDATLSRRGLLRSGGLVATGAVGSVFATGSAASAQSGPSASEVSFQPAGEVSSTDVQAGLEEIDSDKAPRRDAHLTGDSFVDRLRTGVRPWTDITFWGAEDDGSDCTQAIQAAITWAAGAGGGTVLVPPGRYVFTQPIEVPDGVDLWGCGSHQNGGNSKGSVLLAGPGSPQICFGDGPDDPSAPATHGGQSGNLLIDGAFAGTPPSDGLLRLKNCTERVFTALCVMRSRTHGIVATGLQNCTIMQVQVMDSMGDGLVLDSYCENNLFLRCELTLSRGSNLLVQHTRGDQTKANKSQNGNLFVKSLLERGTRSGGDPSGAIHSLATLKSGHYTTFQECGFALSDSPLPDSGSLVVLDAGGVSVSDGTSVIFDSCGFHSNVSDVAAIHGVNSAKGIFTGNVTIDVGGGSGKGVVWDSTGYAAVAGRMSFRSGTKWEGTEPRWENPAEGFNLLSLRIPETGKSNWVPTLNSDDEAIVYVKDGSIVIAFKHGATMKYRMLDLKSTSATWQYATTPP